MAKLTPEQIRKMLGAEKESEKEEPRAEEPEAPKAIPHGSLEELQDLWRESGLSTYALANQSGVPQSSVYRILHADDHHSLDLFDRLRAVILEEIARKQKGDQDG